MSLRKSIAVIAKLKEQGVLEEYAIAAPLPRLTTVAIDVAAPGEAPFKARCLSAEHLIATAVKVGRPKDWARVSEFLEQKSLDLEMLRDVLDRHGLLAAWASFCARAAIKNPLR